MTRDPELLAVLGEDGVGGGAVAVAACEAVAGLHTWWDYSAAHTRSDREDRLGDLDALIRVLVAYRRVAEQREGLLHPPPRR